MDPNESLNLNLTRRSAGNPLILPMLQDWTSTFLGRKASNSFLRRKELFLPTLRFSDSSEPMAILGYPKNASLSNQTLKKKPLF